MIHRCFGGFCHPFHQFFLVHAPLAAGVPSMDHLFADAAVCHADSQVLVRAAEAAHSVSLKVGKGHQGIISGDVAAHGHFLEIFSAFHRQHYSAFFVQNIYRGESPAVYLQGFPMTFRSVAVALIVCVGLHNGGAGNIFFNQFFYPGTGDDVGAVLFPGVEFNGNFTGDDLVLIHFFINFLQAFSA